MNLPKQAYPAAEEASPAAVGKLFEDSIMHLYDDGSLTKVKEDSNWGYFSWTNWKFKYFEKIFQWIYKVASILKNIFFHNTDNYTNECDNPGFDTSANSPLNEQKSTSR